MAQGQGLGNIINTVVGGGGGAGAGAALGGISSVLGPLGAGLGILEGGIQLLSNIGKAKKDKAALEAITDPFYKVQDEYYQNRNIAAGEAGGGMPAATQDYYTSESQRGLSAGIGGTLQSGGGPNDIAKLFDVFNRGIDKTAAASAEQHLKNIQYFKEANKDLAGQKTTQWAINEYQPIQEKKRQLSANIGNEQQNAYAGANTAIGSLSALGTGLQNNQILKSLFGNKTANVSSGITDDPFQISSEPIGSLPPGYGTPPVEAVPNSLSTDEQTAFSNWLKYKKI